MPDDLRLVLTPSPVFEKAIEFFGPLEFNKFNTSEIQSRI